MESKENMKRCEFLIDHSDHKAVVSFVRGSGSTFSDFLRQAVAEKLTREKSIMRLEKIEADLQERADEFRTEIARLRKDLLDDSRRSQELLRADAQMSHKKTQEMTKSFVLWIGGQEAQATPSIKSPPAPRDPWSGSN